MAGPDAGDGAGERRGARASRGPGRGRRAAAPRAPAPRDAGAATWGPVTSGTSGSAPRWRWCWTSTSSATSSGCLSEAGRARATGRGGPDPGLADVAGAGGWSTCSPARGSWRRSPSAPAATPTRRWPRPPSRRGQRLWSGWAVFPRLGPVAGVRACGRAPCARVRGRGRCPRALRRHGRRVTQGTAASFESSSRKASSGMLLRSSPP